MGTQAEAEGASPRFCAEYSEALREDGFYYADYVRVEGVAVDVDAEGKRLCLSGLEHGRDYTITLLEGMPAASGETTARTETFDIWMPNRPPSVRFDTRGYVLPSARAPRLPITAVNTDVVDVRLYHIGERALGEFLDIERFLTPMDRYQATRLAEEDGVEVWRGKADIDSRLNEETVSLLEVGTAMEDLGPGVYVLSASPEGKDAWVAATQWFLISDLAISSFAGPDGLHLFVERLGDGQAVAGAQLSLIARNNSVLKEVTTDTLGYARIAPEWLSGSGGDRPAMLAALGDGADFSFINLREAGFDLSDRGVAGQPAPQPITLFATTERGIYRPGDTVFATALARDAESRAIADLPLTMVVHRPDDKEASRQTLGDQGAGGRVASVPIEPGAMRGLWKLRFYADPEADMLGEVGFLVDDFVPERIDFDLATDVDRVAEGRPPRISVDAQYLYGAPGAHLAIAGRVTRRPSDELSAFPGFAFGTPSGEDETTFVVLPGGRVTGADGRATLAMPIPASASVGQPEVLTLAMQLREGSGRPVERRLELPVALTTAVIGLRARFDEVAPEEASATFDVVALGPGLARLSIAGAAWTLSRIEQDYQWYRVNGEWGYSSIERRTRVGSGEIDIAADTMTALSVPVEWGKYELELRADAGGAPVLARREFMAGYRGGGGSAATPDRLATGIDKSSYASGDELTLRFDARQAGIAFVRVLNGKLVDSRRFEVEAGANELTLDIDERWGTGAYVITSLVTPEQQADQGRQGLNPSRAIGVNWVSVDTAERTLELSLAPTARWRPRETGTLTLSVDNAPAGEPVFATVAAVDLGILNLTGFKAPEPEAYFFGQRRLAFEMRDLYGRLIDNLPGAIAALREGGDSNTASQAPGPKREELVTLFSGLVAVDDSGRATIDLALPAFNGTVRTMAMAWTDSALGSASEDVIVRDPIVATAHVPSFLAPGDRTELSLELAHAEGPTGEVGVELASRGPLIFDLANGALVTRRLTMSDGERQTLGLALSADEVGQGDVDIAVITPDGQRLTQSVPIDVRRNDPLRRSRYVGRLGAGEALVLPKSVVAGFAPEATVNLSFGPLALFDLAGLVSALDHTPWGCTEQLISSAEPLMSARALLAPDRQTLADERLGERVGEVLSRQSASGAFGDWAPGSGHFWLDAYATEFLLRARDAGADVPRRALAGALANLQNKVNSSSGSRENRSAAAYALYVLALAGDVRASDLRYFSDTWFQARNAGNDGGVEAAYLGAALSEIGDPGRANRLFQAALSTLTGAADYASYSRRGDIYASRVRDLAIAYRLALAADVAGVGQTPMGEPVGAVINDALRQASRGNTQEQAAALRVAHSLLEDAETAGLARRMSLAEYRATSVTNPAKAAVDVSVMIEGVPVGEVMAESSGIEISRRYYSLEGERVDVTRVALNDKLVVLLRVTPLVAGEGQLAIEDPLPAGFAIDNPSLVSSGDTASLEWLAGGIKPTHAQFGADRFFAAVTLDEREPFELAYVVRAIRSGRFHHPAAQVQDMYVPSLRASTASGTVVVGDGDGDDDDKGEGDSGLDRSDGDEGRGGQ